MESRSPNSTRHTLAHAGPSSHPSNPPRPHTQASHTAPMGKKKESQNPQLWRRKTLLVARPPTTIAPVTPSCIIKLQELSPPATTRELPHNCDAHRGLFVCPQEVKQYGILKSPHSDQDPCMDKAKKMGKGTSRLCMSIHRWRLMPRATRVRPHHPKVARGR